MCRCAGWQECAEQPLDGCDTAPCRLFTAVMAHLRVDSSLSRSTKSRHSASYEMSRLRHTPCDVTITYVSHSDVMWYRAHHDVVGLHKMAPCDVKSTCSDNLWCNIVTKCAWVEIKWPYVGIKEYYYYYHYYYYYRDTVWRQGIVKRPKNYVT